MVEDLITYLSEVPHVLSSMFNEMVLGPLDRQIDVVGTKELFMVSPEVSIGLVSIPVEPPTPVIQTDDAPPVVDRPLVLECHSALHGAVPPDHEMNPDAKVHVDREFITCLLLGQFPTFGPKVTSRHTPGIVDRSARRTG